MGLNLGRKPYTLGLVISHEGIVSIDLQERMRRREPLIYQELGNKILFGREAVAQEGKSVKEQLTHLVAFFKWFLKDYAPSRLSLKVVLLQGHQDFWELFFLSSLKVKEVTFVSPLYCLKTLSHPTSVLGLVFLEQGMGQTALQVQEKLYFTSQIGFGAYLTRALKHHILKQENLLITAEASRDTWIRFGSENTELTQVIIRGWDQNLKWRNHLVLKEELLPLFRQAFMPFKDELYHLSEVCRHWSHDMPCFWLYGKEHLPESIRTWWEDTFPFKMVFQEQNKMIEGLERCL